MRCMKITIIHNKKKYHLFSNVFMFNSVSSILLTLSSLFLSHSLQYFLIVSTECTHILTFLMKNKNNTQYSKKPERIKIIKVAIHFEILYLLLVSL